MSVRLIPCSEFVNASEKLAVSRLKQKLTNYDGHWILLSNINFSYRSSILSSEIDLVIIGPCGVKVVEIKHWDIDYLTRSINVVENEAEKINKKAKKIAGNLRKYIDPGFVASNILLTKDEFKVVPEKFQKVRGIRILGLPQWEELISSEGGTRFNNEQTQNVARILEPSTKIPLTGDMRSFAELINLERISSKEDNFYRIYHGQHATRRYKVILHLYDLSASQEKNPLALAKREFETIQQWQKSPSVPSLLDSFQEAENYPGELYFFSLVDPDSPTLEERKSDQSWSINARIKYAISAIEALEKFHNPNQPATPSLTHRRITAKTLRVSHNNLPIFTDFRLSRLQDIQTISANNNLDLSELEPYLAPEIISGGLSAANFRSDIFGICATLSILFDGDNNRNKEVKKILTKGCTPDPNNRISLEELKNLLLELEQSESEELKLLNPDYWDQDTIVDFKDSQYKIIDKLGKGGIGQTFKVQELDPNSQEEKFGTYIAKVLQNKENGETILKAYRKVRAYTTHQNLSTIYEIASEWKESSFVALMKWIEGQPLKDLAGSLSFYAEDIETSLEQLCNKWLISLCEALNELHKFGLVHGDVSPGNIIVEQQTSQVILTDYDTVTENMEVSHWKTTHYASPSLEKTGRIGFSDDIYALAASFFYVLTGREPFKHGGETRKDLGLNWENFNELNSLRPFFDKANSSDENERFSDAQQALQFLLKGNNNNQELSPKLTKNHVPWLSSLLTSYPGSPLGNSETRGLDSSFAVSTYVETKLDEILYNQIESDQINLVILFGNAGDGKTAFLQNLGKRFGLDNIQSSKRIWETTLSDQRHLMVNLDGSAAWNGKSANELLDEIFNPFQTADYSKKLVHIVAINSGKLWEWIEQQKEDNYLTEKLRQALMGESSQLDPRFRLIDLNQRSLVGGLDLNKGIITTDFLDRLLEKFLNNSENPWSECQTCSAQKRCSAWKSVQILNDSTKSLNLRNKLIDVLQACHQRGEIHITARELRAALSFIFFGVNDCSELHDNPSLITEDFWQRAFDANSPHRQGELLAELSRFDPALESNPRLDRQLIKNSISNRSSNLLAKLRRREYFLPEFENYERITIANGRFFEVFRKLPLMEEIEQQKLKRDLCLGIARLENLPNLAFSEEHLKNGLPIRIPPRTPTETLLWVVKPWSSFKLETASSKIVSEELEFLHTHIRLIYTYADGNEEILTLSLDLFNLLLDLEAGTQISAISQEGVFSNLEIFTQRLAREDTREIYGWHPAKNNEIFKISIEQRDGNQVLVKEKAL
jgi:serine/threonine protein kinase